MGVVSTRPDILLPIPCANVGLLAITVPAPSQAVTQDSSSPLLRAVMNVSLAPKPTKISISISRLPVNIPKSLILNSMLPFTDSGGELPDVPYLGKDRAIISLRLTDFDHFTVLDHNPGLTQGFHYMSVFFFGHNPTSWLTLMFNSINKGSAAFNALELVSGLGNIEFPCHYLVDCIDQGYGFTYLYFVHQDMGT